MPPSFKSHYEVLGVVSSATSDEIKKAYRSIQLQYHPDKTRHLSKAKQIEGEAISKVANNAYGVVTDEAQRRAYDNSLPSRRSSHPTRATTSQCRAPPPPPPRTYSQELSLSEGDWKGIIQLSERFIPTEWGPKRVWSQEDNVLITAIVQDTVRSAYTSSKDITIAITETPGTKPVRKIESYYKHRVLDGVAEIMIWIKIFHVNAGGVMRDPFAFGWDIETKYCVPGTGRTNYESAMHFYSHKPGVLYGPTPQDEIAKNSDLQPKSSTFFVDMGAEGEKKIDYDATTMWRYAAFGYRMSGAEA